MTTEHDDEPVLDIELAARMVGKRILVGLTYVKYTGDVIEQVQYHGIVEKITRADGMVIRLDNGAISRLPADLRSVEEADPGVYRLRSTGEEVVNPDYLTTWTITRPDA